MRISLTLAICCCSLYAAAQNLGIGTPNPTRAKLEVHGAVDYTAAIFGGDGAGVSLQRSNPGISFNTYYNGGHRYLSTGYGANQFLDAATGNMAISMFGYATIGNYVSTSRRALLLTKEGRVVFGPMPGQGATLNVGKNPGADATAFFQGTTHQSAFHFGLNEHTYIRAGKDGGTVYINDIPGAKTALNGPVGIGTSTPAYPVEIRINESQRGLHLSEPLNGHGWGLSVHSDNPNLYLTPGATYKGYFDHVDASYHHLSDRRVKTAIIPLTSILPAVLKLQAVSYQMKEHSLQKQKSIGFLAQQVAAIFPHIVSIADGPVKGYPGIADLHMLNYRSFGPLVIQAIKEQETIIREQAVTLKNLETELDALEALIDQKTEKVIYNF